MLIPSLELALYRTHLCRWSKFVKSDQNQSLSREKCNDSSELWQVRNRKGRLLLPGASPGDVRTRTTSPRTAHFSAVARILSVQPCVQQSKCAFLTVKAQWDKRTVRMLTFVLLSPLSLTSGQFTLLLLLLSILLLLFRGGVKNYKATCEQ